MADDDLPRRFRVVEGGNEPKPYHRGPGAKQVICRVCEREDGTEPAGPWIAMTSVLWEENGEVVETGETLYYCPWCLRKGRLTEVVI